MHTRTLLARATRTRGRGAGLLAAFAATGIAVAATAGGSSAKITSKAASSSGSPTYSHKVLTLQFDGVPASLNPALGTVLTSAFYYSVDYDPLIWANTNGTFQPDLASSFGYIDHNKAFKLTIRSGAKFSDGSAVTALAVKNSLEYSKNVQGGQGGQAQDLAGVSKIDVTGPKTVVLHFKTATPDMPLLLSQEQDVGDIIGPKGLANPKALEQSSDGTGPYELNWSQSTSGSEYTYSAVPNYWNSKAQHFGGIDIKIIQSANSALAAFNTGQVQYASVDPSTVQGLSLHGSRVVNVPATWWEVELMDRGGQTSKPIGNVMVRQALNYAVDRSAIAKALYGTKYSKPLAEIAAPGTNGYVAADANMYDYNASKAKKLLAQAGYPHGFSVKMLDWNVLDANDAVGQAVASELGKIGVKVQLTTVTNPAQFDQESNSKKFPLVVFPFLSEDMAQSALQLFTLNQSHNAFNSVDPQTQSWLSKAAALPAAKAAPLYQKITTRIGHLAWFLPLVTDPNVYLFSPQLKNAAVSTAEPDPTPTGPTPSSGWWFAG